LAGRATPLATAETHAISGRPLKAPVPDGMAEALFGMGCFWGVERIFWQTPGIWLTMVGYAGGYTPNPTYQEVCTGKTGHNEVVRVIFDPAILSYEALLQKFWENHDPTQGMRQGNDRGTQYRSGIYCYDAAQSRPQRPAALPMAQGCKRRAMVRSQRKSCLRQSFIMPRITISNICTRTRKAIAGLAGRA
jgi:methionine-S-sulfoxide reductase